MIVCLEGASWQNPRIMHLFSLEALFRNSGRAGSGATMWRWNSVGWCSSYFGFQQRDDTNGVGVPVTLRHWVPGNTIDHNSQRSSFKACAVYCSVLVLYFCTSELWFVCSRQGSKIQNPCRDGTALCSKWPPSVRQAGDAHHYRQQAFHDTPFSCDLRP